jgi:hypothetical protein
VFNIDRIALIVNFLSGEFVLFGGGSERVMNAPINQDIFPNVAPILIQKINK